MAFVRKFYTADTHFGHASIIKNCNRPFASVEEMQREIVRRWNSAVGEDDIVYHLGDFGFASGDQRAFHELFNALNGRKYLIIGNHDQDKKGNLKPEIAKLAWAAPPRDILQVNDEGRRVVLCHYPMLGWPARHYGAIHFFGHSHGREQGLGLSRDVGVDLPDLGFTPRTFQELTQGWDFERGLKP